MKFHFLFLTMLAANLTMISCSKEATSTQFSQSPISYQATQNTTSTNLQSIECFEKEGCPRSVGKMTFYSTALINNQKTKKVLSCTGFFIAKNLILTNSHCIPLDLKNNRDEDCSERIFFKNSQGEIAFCKKIIDFSPMDPAKVSIDLALIETEDTEIPHFDVDDNPSAQIVEGNSYYALVFDPGTKNTPPQIKKKICEIGLTRAPFLKIEKEGGSIFTAVSCNIVTGNSGSPLFSFKSHKVFGLNQSIHDPADKIQYRFSNPEQSFLSLGSNLKCLDLGNRKIRLADEDCAEGYPGTRMPKLQNLGSKEIIQLKIENHKKRNAKPFAITGDKASQGILLWQPRISKSDESDYDFKVSYFISCARNFVEMPGQMLYEHEEEIQSLFLDEKYKLFTKTTSVKNLKTLIEFISWSEDKTQLTIKRGGNLEQIPACKN
jgi:hypothetical protein